MMSKRCKALVLLLLSPALIFAQGMPFPGGGMMHAIGGGGIGRGITNSKFNTSCNGAAAASAICSDEVATTTGNFLHVVASGPVADIAALAVTDTAGDTFVCATSGTAGGTGVNVCRAKNITGHATNVIMADFGSFASCGLSSCGLAIIEYSGLNTTTPTDVDVTLATSGTSCLTANFTTATANEVIVISCFKGADGQTFTAGNIGGVASTIRVVTTGDVIAVEDLIVSATQTNITGEMLISSGAPNIVVFTSTYK